MKIICLIYRGYVKLNIMSSVLENYREEILRCQKCGICQSDCPTYEATGDESMVARGRLGLVEAVIDGELKLSERFADSMSKCTSCLSCISSCPCGIDPVNIINAAKGEYFNKTGSDLITKLLLKSFATNDRFLYPLFKFLGMTTSLFYDRIPIEGWLKELLPFVRDGIKKSMPVFGKRNLKNEVSEITRVQNPRMRVVFFTGCMTDFVYQNTGHTILKILTDNNIETIITKDLSCCGAPAYYMGDRKTALSLANKNFNLLNQLNPDYILVNCATCGNMLKSVYNTLLNVNGDFSCFAEKVIDIHKFFHNFIDLKYKKKVIDQYNLLPSPSLQKEAYASNKNRVTLKNKRFPLQIEQLRKKLSSKNKIKVTYHDPCHLKRGQDVYLEPREILKSLPWVEFVEMDNPDSCCGGAGGFNLKHYDLSLDIGKRKAESIKQTGADVVATGCPACQMQITDVLNRAGYNRPVIHTLELFYAKQHLFE